MKGSLWSRLWRRSAAAHESPPELPRFDGQVEELEPRLLFSADAAAVLLPDPGALQTELPPPLTQVMPPSQAVSQPPSREANNGLMVGATMSSAMRTELVFVDAGVPQAHQLLDSILSKQDGHRQFEVHWINSQSDGVAQISAVLQGREGINAIHLISHGQDGELVFGNSALNQANLASHAGQLSGWTSALTPDADLLLYGCDVASSERGQRFVDDLGLLTGADVAASTDLTGASALGGDWALEYQMGAIDSAALLAPASQNAWQQVLATASFQEGTNGYAGTSDTVISAASPDTAAGDAGTIAVTNTTAKQILIKFDNIFGTGAGQIRYGSTINSATLTVYTTQDGTGNPAIYRIINAGWSEASTWNSLTNGISLDNTEASSTPSSSVDVSGNNTNDIFLNLGNTLQLWANGATNNGWVIVDNGNEWNFASSEFATVSRRPLLSVDYTASTPPTLDLDASGAGSNFSTTFVEGGAPVKIADTDASVTAGINNVSNALTSMTVTITNLLDGVAESLAANTSGTNITAAYDSATGVLSLTGTDTAANYQTVLRSVTYNNTDDTPTTTSRSITVVASDPYGGNSTSVTSTMAITATNDAPVITSNGGGATASVSVAETLTTVTTVTSTDPEGTARTYSIVAGNDGAKFSIGSSTGILTFVSAPDYESPTDSNTDNVYVVTVQASDGSLSATQTITVTVTDVGTTLVVDTTSDSNDTGMGTSFTAEQLNARKGTDGLISLREAIIAANTTAGADTVTFNLSSGAGAHGEYTILVASALPNITDAIYINGASQSGYSTHPLIVLDGEGGSGNGLYLSNTADGSTIRGLVIRDFSADGIHVQAGSDNNTIVGNYIGSFNADGSNAGAGERNAGSGIQSYGANLTIGGTTAADRNVISGNTSAYNIYLATGANGTVIQGNYIGTDAAGATVFNTNSTYGIMLENSASNVTIGGMAAGAGNVISGFTDRGMWLTTTGTSLVQGNRVGTDATGMFDLGNGGYGIYVDDGGTTVIGGTAANAGNLVSGNNGGGIYVGNSGGATIQGNTVGLNASGTAALGNTGAGIYVVTGAASTIGGNGASARNVISGNSGHGIQLMSSAAHSVKGNHIGVGSDGVTLLGNGGAGIYIHADGTRIGGKTAGDGNVIAGNAGAGIAVNAGVNNLIYRNSIHSNTGLGIDNDNDGVTANDLNDGDGGANYRTNFPVITSVVTNGSTTTINGSIDWYIGPDTVYIELFSSPSKDASGHGEGKTYLGAAQVTTRAGTGDATFSLTVTGVSVGDWITAVANVESSYLGASEFAMAVQAVAPANAPRGKLIWNRNDALYQQYADWSTSGFSGVGTNGLNLGDDITMIVAAEAPTRTEILFIGSADASGQILAGIWNGSTWSSVISIPVASPSASAMYYDSFAVAYDPISGDAMLVWDNGNTSTTGLSYTTWNGTTWSATGTVTAPVTGEPLHMKLAANPKGHEMVLVVQNGAGSNNQYAVVWNGTSWGHGQTLGTNTDKQYREINVAYESQSGRAMVLYDNSASASSGVQYRMWSGSSWGSEGTVSSPAGLTANSELYSTVMAADPTSNRLAFAAKNANNEVWASVWDGGNWSAGHVVTTTGIRLAEDHATMDIAFESQSGDLLVAYGKSTGPYVYYQTWSNGSGWSVEGTGPSMGGTDVPYVVKLYADPYSNTIMLGSQDNAGDLNMATWDGGAWGSVSELDGATGLSYRENFTFVWYHNAPVIGDIAGDTLAYTEGQAATVIDQGGNGTVTMGDETAYNGATLTISFTGGSTSAEDVLGIRNEGTGAGQIGVSGSDVTHGGTVIGTFTGGSLGASLVITLNANANNAAVTALSRNITYQNTNTAAPSTAVRTVRFAATNALGESAAPSDAMVTITAVNDAPTNTVPGAQGVNEDSTLVFHSTNGNLISIADVDAANATVQVTLSVTQGTLTLSGTAGLTFASGDGALDSNMSFTGTVNAINAALSGMSYVPPSHFTGGTVLTLTTSDLGNSGTGGALTNTDTVAITVNPVNDAPVTSNVSASGNEDSVINGTVTATDADGDAVTFAKGSDPTHGSVTVNSDGTFSYTPTANFNGSDVFTVVASDGQGGTATSTVTISVNPVNDAPVTSNVSVTGNEDSVITGTVTATDLDGDALTFAKGSDPTHGSVTVNSDGTFSYTPTANFTGNDVFTVIASDGQGGTATSTVTITVNPVNDAPVTSNVSASGNEDSVINGTVTATDADGDAVTFAKGSDPTHGSVTVNSDGTFSYTPTANFNGSDVFTVIASDGQGGTATSTVTISVNPVNDAPVTSDVSASGNEDTVITGTVSATDLDGDALTFAKGSDPTHGSVTVNSDGTFSYTPTANFTGNDVFTVIASDGQGGTATSTVTITVNPVNDAPVTSNVSASGNEDTAITGTVTATDADGDTVTFTKGSNPTHGTATVNSDGTFSYTPAANFTGSDVFTVIASDGQGGTATSTVTITVAPVNDVPVTSDVSASGNEDTVITGTVSATDADGDTVTFTKGSNPTHGSVTVNSDGTFSYTPTANFTGNDVFTVIASDGQGGTATSTVTITVNPVNDAPVTSNVSASGNEDTAITGTVTATDADGDTVTFTKGSNPTHGTVTVNSDGTFSYTPAANFNGSDVFTVIASDGQGGTATSTVTITVAPVNDVPVTSDVSASGNEDTVITGTVTATDLDGDALTFGKGSDPTHGSVTVNSDGTFSYTPTANFTGSDVFTVIVSDGQGGTATSTVTISVNPINDAPVTSNVSASGNEDTAITGTVTATDADGDTLTFTKGSNPAHGTVTVNSDGTFSYTPAANFNGSDVFTVIVSDGQGGTATSTVTITVNPVNDAPVITAGFIDATATGDVTLSIGTLLAQTVDPDGPGLTVHVSQAPQHGTLTILSNGDVRYVANNGYTGADQFVYEANDGLALSGNSRTVRLSVQAAPTPQPTPEPTQQPTVSYKPPEAPVLKPTPTADAPAPSPEPSPPAPDKEPPEPPTMVSPAEPAATEEPQAEPLSDVTGELTRTANRSRLGDALRALSNATGVNPVMSFSVAQAYNLGLNGAEPSLQQLQTALDIGKVMAIEPVHLTLSALSSSDGGTSSTNAQVSAEDQDDAPANIKLTRAAAYSTSLGLSIGTVWWTARVSGLLTSALISTPAWRALDPLPVLTSPSEDEDVPTDDHDLERMFEGDKRPNADVALIE